MIEFGNILQHSEPYSRPAALYPNCWHMAIQAAGVLAVALFQTMYGKVFKISFGSSFDGILSLFPLLALQDVPNLQKLTEDTPRRSIPWASRFSGSMGEHRLVAFQ